MINPYIVVTLFFCKPTMEATKTIYSKLLEIQKTLLFFKKEKSWFNNNFQYVEWSSLLAEIREQMDKQWLILKQEIIDIKSTVVTYHTSTKEKTEVLVEAKFRFTWVDCETGEKDENLFCANWFNDFDKWVGSASTYAERYFLLKYFHIPTDKDDNDSTKKVWERDINKTFSKPIKKDTPNKKKIFQYVKESYNLPDLEATEKKLSSLLWRYITWNTYTEDEAIIDSVTIII